MHSRFPQRIPAQRSERISFSQKFIAICGGVFVYGAYTAAPADKNLYWKSTRKNYRLIFCDCEMFGRFFLGGRFVLHKNIR